MTDDRDDKRGHRAELNWAGLELGEPQFAHYCEAWPHTKALRDRVPRERPLRDQSATRFEPEGANPEQNRGR